MIRRLVMLLCVLGTAVSCSTKKLALEGEAETGMKAADLIEKHYQQTPEFRTLSGKMRIDFSDGDSDQSFNVSFRMEKDKAIWISAPLGLVKAYITPERVSFYNKLENEYFDGDFRFLSQFLGVPLDFDKVQNLLLGRTLFNLRQGTYRSSIEAGEYTLEPRKQEKDMKVRYHLDPAKYLLVLQQLSQPEAKRLMEVRYGDFRENGTLLIPSEFNIIAIEGTSRNLVGIQYRNLEVNRQLSFPYRIPDGYEEILLQ